METKLSEHRRDKKMLIPPLSDIPATPSSWLHSRLPEMLWSVLIIGNLERVDALNFFRYVGRYVQSNNIFADVTHTALSKISENELKLFIEHLIGYSTKIKLILRPLCNFPQLPAIDIWKSTLGAPEPMADASTLVNGIIKTLDHQSQEATDCRWAKILCLILGKRLSVLPEVLSPIVNYPSEGDMHEIRPIIRATEIAMPAEESSWSNAFWDWCYENSQCMPEDENDEKQESLHEDFEKQLTERRNYYLTQNEQVLHAIITHFFQVTKTSSLDVRKEVSFGLAMYSLAVFTELNFYDCSHSILGRTGLRTLIETYITFEYLLKKEKATPEIWKEFQEYGKGQTKSIYLKLKDKLIQNNSIDFEQIRLILNEDQWSEHTSINIGQWSATNLRAMSEEAGVKDIYDAFYEYASSYVHGNGFALRTSSYQFCANPLHRYHRIPKFGMVIKPSVIPDSILLLNKILSCLALSYPTFTEKLVLFSEDAVKKINEKK